jgi:WD40 repeat protein
MVDVPRTERPLEAGEDVLTDFAADLRLLREKAGSPPYRELARRAHYSSSTLADAAGGRRLPSLAVTLAYVRACGADPATWEARWHAVAAELASVQADQTNPALDASADCPYVGLAVFQTGDAGRFFGRERLTEDLVDQVRRNRLVVVFGASGSGKSSLLRAGLLSRTGGDRTGGDRTRDDRTHGDRTHGDRTSVDLAQPAIVLSPGPHPLQECAAQLAAFGGGSAAAIHRELGQNPLALHLTVLQTLANHPQDVDLLIVVDQFEEVFTQCDHESERAQFITALTTATRAVNSRARVVLGVRADFYARCAQRPDLVDALRESHLLVGPMTTEELRRAISQPALDAGCTVEGALVARIVADATGQAGVLPLVSHALRETWLRRRGNTLTVAGYEASGGLRHALARTADAVYTNLTTEQRQLARTIFLRLVAVGEGTGDTKRRLNRDQLDPDTDPVLNALAGARLVTLDVATVELAHEALLDAWPRLRAWLDEDRAGLLIHQQLGDAAALWQRENQDPGVLYRGGVLAAATEWARRHDADLRGSTVVVRFLAAANRQESRTARLRTVALAALSVLTLLACVGTVVAIQQRSAARAALNRAVAAQTAVEAEQLRDTDVSLAAQLSLAAYRLRPTPQTYTDLLSTENVPLSTTLTGHKDIVYAVAFTRDGRTLATAGRDNTVRLWNLSDPHHPSGWGPPLAADTGYVYWVAFSPDGHTLATAGRDGTVRLWNVGDPAHPTPWGPPLRGHTSYVFSVDFSPDGRTLVSAGYDHELRFWNVADPARAEPLGPPVNAGTDAIASAAFSPDGHTVASAGHDRTIRLWNVTDPAHPTAWGPPIAGHGDTVYATAFSPDGRTLASVSNDHTVRLWNVADPAHPGALGRPLLGHTDTVYAVAFSADGRTVATAGADHGVRLWSVADPAHPIALGQPMNGHTGYVYWLAFGPDGHSLASASGDGTVRLWDIPQTLLNAHLSYVNTAAFSPSDGRVLASGSTDGTVRLWNVADPVHPVAVGEPLSGHTGAVVSVSFSRDGNILASSGRDHTVRLWSLADPVHPSPMAAPLSTGTTVASVQFSPSQATLAVAHSDGTIQLWNLADPGHPTPWGPPLVGHRDAVHRVAFSPTGDALASAGADDTVRLWQVTDPAHPTLWGPPLDSQTGGVLGVAFSPSGRTLATANQDDTVRLWDVTDRRHPARVGEPLTGHRSFVYSVGFSPDGHTLASSSGDNTIRLWDVTNTTHATALGQVTGHTGPIDGLAFSPRGQVLASASDDYTVALWDLDVSRAIDRICAVTGNALDAQQWRRYIPEATFDRPC